MNAPSRPPLKTLALTIIVRRCWTIGDSASITLIRHHVPVGPSGGDPVVKLSRPSHYMLFGVFLLVVFAATFQATQSFVHAGEQDLPMLNSPEDIDPIRVTPIETPGLPEEPVLLPDLAITQIEARECIPTEPTRPGGTLTFDVENLGPGRTGGFRLFIETTVENTDTGVSLLVARDHYIENLAPGERRTFTVGYAFPLQDLDPVGPLWTNEPVPGSYSITTTIDRPTGEELAFLGPAGVIVETDDETNNVAHLRTNGTAQGIC
jgi:hypothetical protein